MREPERLPVLMKKGSAGLVAVNSDSTWVYTKGLYAFYAHSIGPLEL